MFRRNIITTTILLSSIFILGCSSAPTTADLMRQEARSLQNQVDLKKSLARDLSKGKKMISEGQSTVNQANDMLQKGNVRIAEGEKLVDETKRIYTENFPNSQIEFQ